MIYFMFKLAECSKGFYPVNEGGIRRKEGRKD